MSALMIFKDLDAQLVPNAEWLTLNDTTSHLVITEQGTFSISFAVKYMQNLPFK